MNAAYGKIRLTLPGGIEQEFALGKTEVTLGRGQTSDIVVPDARVSRAHARLECGPQGCAIVDLGSANKTRVNGVAIERVDLKPGDTISLGQAMLHFEREEIVEEPEVTLIDSEAQLEATLAEMTLDMTLNDTQAPRLAVHTPGKTWEVAFIGDVLTIGRHGGNDVQIDHPKVSRQHARIERRGDDFVLRDLGSANGTWIKNQRVEEHTLQDGDMLLIGDGQLVFKYGFKGADLTIMDEIPTGEKAARCPVVFVPGFMGSELWLGNERVWPNVKYLFKNPEVFQLPNDIPLEPRGLVGEVVIVPNLIKSEQYNRLGDYFIEDLGYQREVDFLEFAYDWRQDVRLSAQRLAEAIDDWDVTPPITLIGHSLGTLVSRYYVEKLGGKQVVGRLVLLGGPHLGVPKAATSLLLRPELLPFGFMGEKLRQILATFPSSYQILPVYHCISDQDGASFNLIEDETWLSGDQRTMLVEARRFRQDLGLRSSVPTISIFGYGLKTITRLHVQRDRQGDWQSVNFDTAPSGDGTIPEVSAVLEGTEIHPVQQYHGVLYVDNDVKMRLKMELTRPVNM